MSDHPVVNLPPEGNPGLVQEQPQLPEKLQGKSVQEIADMYQNLESRMGDQSMEIGQLRRLNEAAVQRVQEDVAKPPLEFDRDNPAPYIQQVVADTLRPVAGVLAEQKQESFEAKLTEKYPDWKDTVKDDAFGTWVGESEIRLNLFSQAHHLSDFSSAAELFDNWKNLNGIEQKADEAVQTAVKKERKLKAASTERGGSVDTP